MSVQVTRAAPKNLRKPIAVFNVSAHPLNMPILKSNGCRSLNKFSCLDLNQQQHLFSKLIIKTANLPGLW